MNRPAKEFPPEQLPDQFLRGPWFSGDHRIDSNPDQFHGYAVTHAAGNHSLAWWIGTKDQALLFDTGQGTTLRHNAERLSLPLPSARAVLLSHGHYDHVGGCTLRQPPRPA